MSLVMMYFLFLGQTTPESRGSASTTPQSPKVAAVLRKKEQTQVRNMDLVTETQFLMESMRPNVGRTQQSWGPLAGGASDDLGPF